MARFTPTEQRMIDVLSDGQSHRFEELFACLDDELASRQAVSSHLHNIRNKIKPIGETIICESVGTRRYYRHVRFLHRSSSD